jgi:hypothetical protein
MHSLYCLVVDIDSNDLVTGNKWKLTSIRKRGKERRGRN